MNPLRAGAGLPPTRNNLLLRKRLFILFREFVKAARRYAILWVSAVGLCLLAISPFA
jgi:hypothetical protein